MAAGVLRAPPEVPRLHDATSVPIMSFTSRYTCQSAERVTGPTEGGGGKRESASSTAFVCSVGDACLNRHDCPDLLRTGK